MWTPVLDPAAPFLAPFIGVAILCRYTLGWDWQAAKLAGIAALRLANADILPFDFASYALYVPMYSASSSICPCMAVRSCDLVEPGARFSVVSRAYNLKK